MRRRSTVLGFRLAIGSGVCLVVRITGRLGSAVSRYNVASGKRLEARSHHVFLREQPSAVVDPRHKLGHTYLLGLEISVADNEHQASDR